MGQRSENVQKGQKKNGGKFGKKYLQVNAMQFKDEKDSVR